MGELNSQTSPLDNSSVKALCTGIVYKPD